MTIRKSKGENMKKITEDLVKKLAYEERLCIYTLARKGEISPNEIENYMYAVENLTKINLSGINFDFETVNQLGIDNCCAFFKALCEQYSKLASPDNEFARYEASQVRCEVEVPGSNNAVPQKMSIGLHDCASMVDKAIDENYNELKVGCMYGNSDESIYRYAQVGTIADVYYRIRDLIEGKNYFDGKFMSEYRELGPVFASQSDTLIANYARRKNISKEEAKQELRQTLDDGFAALSKTPIKVEKHETTVEFKPKNK